MLVLHRAERSTTLASALGDVLATPLSDPFGREVVAVPAKGVERWLTQRLSTVLGSRPGVGDGVAANIDFPSPARLVDECLAAATGVSADDDPWNPSRVLWALLGVVDDCLGAPWCAVLAKHLGHGLPDRDPDDHRPGRRYATASHLTDLFRSYAAQRPAMLVDWAGGRDTDGAGGPLDDDLLWQAELWRRLRERVGSPAPAERLDSACARLRAEPHLVELPARLSLFGPTRLATDQIAVLAALAVNRDVHLWLPHPSPAMWSSLSTTEGVLARADDHTALSVAHPLLSSLARDVRELESRLTRLDVDDIHHEGPAPRDSLLGCLQADVRDDRAPALAECTADTSVQVHACHGPARQVEVLRECLLHLFEDDPTLEPRDVLVMCPDVESYAPLIRAAFGQDVLGHPGHRLRVRLADRALHQTNPVLAVVSTLLELADARVTASQVLDLSAAAPVRRRFRFGDDDLERVREWATATGARWGIGPRQRASFGLGDFPQNTFTTALDRILLGAAADESEGEWLALALPLDDVDSNDIDLTGRLAEFVDRLDVALRGLGGPQSVAEWSSALTRALDLLVDVSAADTWQLAQARRELGAAMEHGGDALLRLSDVRAMLATRLAGRPTRANFRTGELTVCTMVPMRSVPHRVVVLLGLDDEVFPRGVSVDGDDVLARNPLLGERDPRSEDRQLLLDAVMSASEKLLLFYTGADPVTGMARPPAIPLSELLDAVAATVGSDALPGIVTRHPLQPFDARNFRPEHPFSFDRAALAGARAAQHPPEPEPAFLPAPLVPPQREDVDLADLIAFLVHPTQAFLRQRLGLRVPDVDEDLADALEVSPDPLARWDLGQRMLVARLAGVELADFRAAEWRRGTLPPFKLGESVLGGIEHAVESLVAVSGSVHVGRAETVDVDVDLGSGRRLTGTVGGVHGSVIASTTYSKLGPKHRLTAWAQLLAVAASDNETEWTAVTTGRGAYSRPAWRSTLTAPENAAEELVRLVELRDLGLHAPLPIATGASAAYAERRHGGSSMEDAIEAARKEWSSDFGDSRDRHITYVYGSSPGIDVLGDTVTIENYARQLWAPLLAAETLAQP
ncbi:exodeoxyribonuclease V subunit gamma [Rhodococcus sp. JS3073]|uniref:exodeoxyribonuclease V subunit gamma n=1 Tax=Rhodococcus sp. JS3073 TaxID=3002901 RepID=UPI002286423A|nr:exodeoxyribonuclease V subunit gamma [Rhodococcus sp. JS3073]WAM13540.1 exodeoxyribonuclease V subunit gamma [Rhodococcus sp. JS3073]